MPKNTYRIRSIEARADAHEENEADMLSIREQWYLDDMRERAEDRSYNKPRKHEMDDGLPF